MSYSGTPLSVISFTNPTPVDDTTIPGGGPDVLDKQSYRAVRTAYAHSGVDGLLQARYASGLELYGTKATVLSTGFFYWRIQVACSFRNPDDSLPPPGEREVMAIVRVHPGLAFAYVESYWTE